MANKITTFFSFQEEGNGLKRISQQIKETDGAWNKARVGFKAGIDEFRGSNAAQAGAIAGLGVAAYKAIGLASELEESVNAVTVTYGDNADAVLAIGENAATSFGLSKSEFNGMAVQFASFAEKVTGEGGDVAATIDDIATRAADFASVMNLDVAEAARIFQSALSGEQEPIKKFGVDMSAAAVEAYALANGLAASKSEITESVKVQARYGLLMEQTNKTAGDFANTSDSLANSQRIAAAQAKDLAAEIGTTLAPALGTVIQGLSGVMEALNAIGFDDAMKFIGELDVKSQSVGRSIRRTFDATADANWALVDSVEAADAAAAEFDMTLLDGLTTFAEVRAKVEELTGSQHAANQVALKWAEAQELAAGQTVEQKEALVDTAEMYGEYGAAAKQALEDEAAAAQAARDALKDLTAQYNEQQDAIEDLISSKLELVGGDLDVRDAQRRARQAASELDNTIGDLTEGTDEYQAAVDEATEAQWDAAAAAANQRAAQMEANGSTVDAKVKAQLMAEELYALAGTLNGPLKDAVLGYIAQLLAIPTNISTRVTVTGGGGVTGLAIGGSGRSGVTGVGGNMSVAGRGAEGAVVNTPTVALIGEAGPEALVPLHKLPGNAPIETMLGRGGTGSNFYLTVNAGINADGPEISRIVIDAIKKYERFNGPGWRR